VVETPQEAFDDLIAAIRLRATRLRRDREVAGGGEEKILDAECWMTKKKLVLDSGRWSLDSLFREF
jgi:hypothetical protein